MVETFEHVTNQNSIKVPKVVKPKMMYVIRKLFGLRSSPYSNYLCRTTDIAAVENIYNIFIFKICRAKIRTRQREYALRITAQSRVLKTDTCREATLKKVHYTTIQYVNETLYYCHSIAIKSEREGTMGCLLP